MLEQLGVPPQLLGWVLLAALPVLLMACTAFAKVSVVLASLRLGLGAETLLPYGVLFTLALVVTTMIMAPTGLLVIEGVEGLGDSDGVVGSLGADLAQWWSVLSPICDFMSRHTHGDELEFFAQLQGVPQTSPLALVPAFLTTELSEAFHMAVLILLPFVIVDLIVAQLLVLLGMQQQPTMAITVPAKILLFLAAGGWDVILGGLVEGYL